MSINENKSKMDLGLFKTKGTTGLYNLSPFHTKGEQTKKVSICLFTCVTVQAIHLDVVDDITSKEFLIALRRFI